MTQQTKVKLEEIHAIILAVLAGNEELHTVGIAKAAQQPPFSTRIPLGSLQSGVEFLLKTGCVGDRIEKVAEERPTGRRGRPRRYWSITNRGRAQLQLNLADMKQEAAACVERYAFWETQLKLG